MKSSLPALVNPTFWKDIPVVRLSAGGYTADVCAAMGANCIRFARENINVLRTPDSFEGFRRQPNVYGSPLLFPPNRIQNGIYFYNNHIYQFPINEPERGNHIHGFLSETLFLLTEAYVQGNDAKASFTLRFTKENPYLTFPHEFMVTIAYCLNKNGLDQKITIQNNSKEEMPVGLGFHTAFQVPFLPDTAPDEYRVKAHVGEEILLDPVTAIPTSEREFFSPTAEKLGKGELSPIGKKISNHFAQFKGEIILSHLPTGAKLHYRPDSFFSFLMLWNGQADHFICIEPQSWQVNAPNVSLAKNQTGFFALKPGKSLVCRNSLSIDL